MKKFLMAFMCLAAVALVGCSNKSATNVDPNKVDDTVEKCWDITVKMSAYGVTETEHEFFWGTERDCVILCQEEEKAGSMGPIKTTASYKATGYKTEEACHEADMRD